MIVEIIRSEPEPSLEAVARQMLGQLIWVQWPHLTRAKVISVSNEKQRLHLVDNKNGAVDGGAPYTVELNVGNLHKQWISERSTNEKQRFHLSDNKNGAVDGGAPYTVELNVGNLHKQWISERSTVIEHNMGRLGIELGDVNILIHAVNLKGYKYLIEDNTRMVLEPEWCSVSCGHALQATVAADQARTAQARCRLSTPQEAYPPGHTVFLLTPTQYYGQSAKVIDSESIRSGRIKVLVTERQEPVPTARTVASPYMNANHAAASCGITTALLSRITGSVFVVPGARHSLPTDQLNKTNVGLNLKFNKKVSTYWITHRQRPAQQDQRRPQPQVQQEGSDQLNKTNVGLNLKFNKKVSTYWITHRQRPAQQDQRRTQPQVQQEGTDQLNKTNVGLNLKFNKKVSTYWLTHRQRPAQQDQRRTQRLIQQEVSILVKASERNKNPQNSPNNPLYSLQQNMEVSGY
ncbi:unnamed protein product [Plutella xylostella]|uniref:(diamondback moth) hypothetical protein n=1 Tax=Plutella xylostella TaxID=51655 RepID=A0A8S4FZ72_PLUXY|nr:unnamed protein product [Plutella xylostella]